jgi:hypothetical protein
MVAQLLNATYVKLIGGAVIIWIAVAAGQTAEEECHGKEAQVFVRRSGSSSPT